MAKIYELKSQNYILKIVPEYGMNCISAVCTKPYEDILKVPHDVDILGNDDAFLFGVPVLFFPNRISNGKFEFEGRKYLFPINEPELNNFCHGTLHKLPFEVTEHSDKHIKGIFAATKERPYMTFPHTFEFFIEYGICDDGIYQIAEIKNTSAQNMPVALGFHTTFNLSDKYMLKIPAEKEVERNMETYLPTGRVLNDFELKQSLNSGTFNPGGKTISKLFELSGRKMKIYNEETKVTISYIFDEKYKYCMFYSRNGKDHICIEPQTWITDCPNLNINRAESGFDFIAPGDCRIYKSFIKAE